MRHLSTTLALTAALLFVGASMARAGMYSKTKKKTYKEANTSRTFTYTSMPRALSKVSVQVELWGDYLDGAGVTKSATVSIDKIKKGNMCTTGCSPRCNTTAHAKTFQVAASTVSDGKLQVQVINNKSQDRCSRKEIQVTVSYKTNAPPKASDSEVRLDEDTQTTIELMASDPDGDMLTYEYVAKPQHGTLSGKAPKPTYTPDANYNGPDELKFKAHDPEKEQTKTATVSITVKPVNDPPTWTSPTQQSFRVPVGRKLTLLAQATDIDDENLTYGLKNAPMDSSFAKSDGEFAWTPAADQTGAHELTFTATDGEATIERTVTVRVFDPDADAGTADTGHPTPDTGHPTPDTGHQTPDTAHPTPDTGHRTPDTDPTYGLQGGGGCSISAQSSALRPPLQLLTPLLLLLLGFTRRRIAAQP